MKKKSTKQSELTFQLIVESAPSAMVMIGPAGQIVMVNAQSEKLFGYARDEMLGQPIEILVPERFRGKHPGLRTAFFSRPPTMRPCAKRSIRS